MYTLKELVEYTARLIGVRRMIVGLSDGLSRLQARALEFVPGKPFSWDNYLSMQRDSVCSEGFPEIFQIRPADIDAVVPMYLSRRSIPAQPLPGLSLAELLGADSDPQRAGFPLTGSSPRASSRASRLSCGSSARPSTAS